MCEKLAELDRAMGVFTAGFEPALVSGAQAEGVLERAARIEHMAATLKALAAGRMAETELWRMGGDKTPAHMLGRKSGESVSKAQRQLDNAKRLAKHPKTNAAARAGALSPEQQADITDAADADPGCEDDLLGLARRASPGELAEEAARRKGAVQEQDEKHKRTHDERHVRSWTGPSGAWRPATQGPPEAGARFMARLQPVIDAIFNTARAQ